MGAGQGKRMGASRNKILLHLIGKPVISYSLNTFFNDPACKHIILVTQEDEQDLLAAVVKKENKKKCPVTIVSGGSERQFSVFNGLKTLLDPKNIVMVHDGARPFVSLGQLKLLHRKVQETRAAILGVPVKDTIKRVVDGIVEETVPRETLWQVQTPQAFYGEDLLAAHARAQQEGYLGTDDASLIEKYSQFPVSMVLGSYENIKLTTPEDMLIGEAIVKRRRN
ncbi:2-C-methyl-D-erythritol 4-phosphate cytidylyltransferase [Enterococcus caccae]|nr:2-C-methyl-D-erythritol 4-phosphate cytidylyltransferase [Enterococcus caccae]